MRKLSFYFVFFTAFFTLYQHVALATYNIEYVPSPKSKKLIIVFSSRYTDGPEFKRTALRLRADEAQDIAPNCLFISQPESWYLEDFEVLKAILQEYINKIGAKNTFLIGSSMGGWGALLFGSFFPDAHVIAFSPQTCIDPSIPLWVRYEAPTHGEISDLKSLVKKRKGKNRGKTLIIVAANEYFDLAHAFHLKSSNAVQVKVINIDEEKDNALLREFHNIAGVLAEQRALTPILQDFIASNGRRISPYLCECPISLRRSSENIFQDLLGENPQTPPRSVSRSLVETFKATLILRQQLQRTFNSPLYKQLMTLCTELLKQKSLSTYEHVAELINEQVPYLLSDPFRFRESIKDTKKLIIKMDEEIRRSGFDSLADQLQSETESLFKEAAERDRTLEEEEDTTDEPSSSNSKNSWVAENHYDIKKDWRYWDYIDGVLSWREYISGYDPSDLDRKKNPKKNTHEWQRYSLLTMFIPALLIHHQKAVQAF